MKAHNKIQRAAKAMLGMLLVNVMFPLASPAKANSVIESAHHADDLQRVLGNHKVHSTGLSNLINHKFKIYCPHGQYLVRSDFMGTKSDSYRDTHKRLIYTPTYALSDKASDTLQVSTAFQLFSNNSSSTAVGVNFGHKPAGQSDAASDFKNSDSVSVGYKLHKHSITFHTNQTKDSTPGSSDSDNATKTIHNNPTGGIDSVTYHLRKTQLVQPSLVYDGDSPIHVGTRLRYTLTPTEYRTHTHRLIHLTPAEQKHYPLTLTCLASYAKVTQQHSKKASKYKVRKQKKHHAHKMHKLHISKGKHQGGLPN